MTGLHVFGVVVRWLIDRMTEAQQALEKEYPEVTVRQVVVDLSSMASAKAGIKAVKDLGLSIDYFIGNAAVVCLSLPSGSSTYTRRRSP